MRHFSNQANLRRTLCAGFAIAALSAFALPAAHAQTYPIKPIKFIVPFSGEVWEIGRGMKKKTAIEPA